MASHQFYGTYAPRRRVPANAGRVILAPVSGQENTYDMIRADNPTVTGTAINRDLLMAMQGFVAGTTTFNADGSISETGEGGTKVTTFGSDGSITEKFTGSSGKVITKKTVFNSDGSIVTTIS